MPLPSALTLGVVVGAAVVAAASSMSLHAYAAAPGELLFEFGELGYPSLYEWEIAFVNDYDIGPRGEIVTIDHGNRLVQVFHANGTFDFSFEHGLEPYSGYVYVGPDGSIVIPVPGPRAYASVNVFQPNGTFDFSFKAPVLGAIDVGPDGAIFVPEYNPFKLNVYHPNGTLDYELEGQERGRGWQGLGDDDNGRHHTNDRFVGVAPDGVIVIAMSDGQTVKKFHPNGTLADTLWFPSVDDIAIGPTGEFFLGHVSRIYHPNGTLAGKLHRSDGFGVGNTATFGRIGPMGEVVVMSDSSAMFAVHNGIEPTDDLRAAPAPAPAPLSAPLVPVAAPPALSLTGVAHAFEVGSVGAGPGEFFDPAGIAFGPGGVFAVADSSNHRVQVFHANGTFAFEFGGAGRDSGEFFRPYDVAFGPGGLLAVSDMGNARVQVFRVQ